MFTLLLRSSWRVVFFAILVGVLGGVSSLGLIFIIHRTLRDPAAANTHYLAIFVTLCVVVLTTRIVSQVLLTRLAQDTVSEIRLRLCQRILESPLRSLEVIGDHRLLASLTGDVVMISQAANGIPVLCINVIILICGGIYLASMSKALLACAIIVCALAAATYLVSARFARDWVRRGRESHDGLHRQIRAMIAGLKELKMHRFRRREFIDDVLAPAVAEVRDTQFVAFSLQGAAVSWGRIMFFVTIGLLLFVWPRFQNIDSATLTGYALTIIYLMSPVEQIMAWLPFTQRASASVRKIRRLGLALDEQAPEATEYNPSAIGSALGREIELKSVGFSYRGDLDARDFVVGPIDLILNKPEIIFIAGGNGSGKTTLAKLITGLYEPNEGELRIEGRPVVTNTRESYRQLFSVVFDVPAVFDSLLGIHCDEVDQQANGILRQLKLSDAVSVSGGAFSTTTLSRGQNKRLALLTALLEDRPIVVFDEWAADQDPESKRYFYEELLPSLKRKGKTVVAITHDDRYFPLADRLFKLENGIMSLISSGN